MRASVQIILDIVQIVLALVGAVLLLLPLAQLFGAMNWPKYHDWGILHGGFFSAIPALAIATYSLLGLIPGLRRPNDIWQRIAGLAVGLTITSLLVLTIPGPPRPIWKALHYAIFLLAFLSAAGLCYSATRSSLVALMIPLPLLFDDLQFFIPFDRSTWAYVRYGMVRITLPIVLAACLGCLISLAVKRSRRSPA
jgi:hypothetical protein